MAIFKYVATDKKGTRISGSVDARSKDFAVSLLKQKDLYIISIQEQTPSFFASMLTFTGISNSEIVSATRQLSTMISAGLAISNSLQVLINQTKNKNFKKVLYDVLKSVEGGASLSSSMSKHPNVFDATYYSLVGAGESSGSLDVILERLASRLEEERELEAKFKGAMIYPAIVTIAMIVVFFGLMIFVVPKLSNLYNDLDVKLPAVTQLMIYVSKFIVDNATILILISITLIFLFRAFLKTQTGSLILSEIVFRLPIFGRIVRLRDLDKFTSTLSLLLNSAVPIVESLNIVSTVVTNTSYKNAAKEAAVQVEKGTLLSEYFKSNEIFPPLVAQMAGVGQETGQMDQVLSKISKYFKSELDHLIDNLSSALEPIILVVIGVGVGFLIISIITPIYQITSAI